METNQKLLAACCHASFFIGFAVIVPLIILLVVKDSDFVKHHAKQALVSQLAFYAAYAIAAILTVILIGLVILPILFIVQIVLTIIAIIKTVNEEYYKYPLTGSLADKL